MEGNKADHEFSWLRHLAPEFPIDGSKIEILDTPERFHSTLVKEARRAKKRIVLAALYLGTGTLEKELISAVEDAAKKSGNNIKVDILLDYVRGSRGNTNSRTMLQPLMEQFGNSDNLSIALYHTPNLRGLFKKFLPPRWNETIGVAHLKAFIFDDTFVISGANLSNDYFVDRQDRYMVFHDCSQLANYFHGIVSTVSRFSFHLLPSGKVTLLSDWHHHPFDGDFDGFIHEAHNDVKSHIVSSLGPEARSVFGSNEQLAPNLNSSVLKRVFTYSSALLKSVLPNWNSSASDFDGTVKRRLNPYSAPAAEDISNSENADTWIYPTIQMGLFGIRQDEIITESLMKSFPKGSDVSFTTGYFNVTDKYCDTMVENDANYKVILSSPEANGFYGSHGFGKYIPAVYIHLCHKFYRKVLSAGRSEDFTLLEYMRNGWTFHGKGMWCYLPGHKIPTMTLIGSPNFGLRSVHRDLEAQLVLVTKNKNLQKKLHHERNNLARYTQRITKDTFEQTRYKVPRWVALVTFFIKKYF